MWAFIVLGVSTGLTFLESVDCGLEILFTFPGMILDAILSGNIHAGFGTPWKDFATCIAGTFFFWMIPVSVIVWLTTRKSSRMK